MPKLASLPFSVAAAAAADQGLPAMVTRAVPGQVATYESLAGRVRERITRAGAAGT